MHVLKLTEWQTISGWHCADVEDLANNSAHWLHPARLLGMTPADYIKWAIDFCNPIVTCNSDYTIDHFRWDRQSDMRKFKNYINKIAREKKYFI